ncbi:ADP-binding protein [Agrobacterium tumefaciens]|nr:ADP-binding protein [Agrobacterium tumefaciens]
MSEDILPITIPLEGEKDTIRLGEDLALALKPGDCLALIGDLGTGKSTLARAFIRAVADEPDLEVPSPTFTIIQTYDARIPSPILIFTGFRMFPSWTSSALMRCWRTASA